MIFSDIRGNDEVKKALLGMVESGRVPHSILFHEDDGGGAFPIVLAFLDLLYSGNPRVSKLIHPDIHFIFPAAASTISQQYMNKFRSLALQNPSFTEGNLNEALGLEGKNSLIAVTEAKHLLEVLSLSAMEGGLRSVVIYLPEKMNQEASNRLLKIVEEPPQNTQFLFITHAPEKVLQTISSRCQRMRIVPPVAGSMSICNTDNSTFDQVLDGIMSALASRDLFSSIEACESVADLPSRENMKAFCRYALSRLRLVFLLQQEMQSLAGACVKEMQWASCCRKSFPRLAMEAFSRASGLIDRNVNSKIVFTDLADRLFTAF